jgi:pyruvate dehydrogenase E1 component alpha subunit
VSAPEANDPIAWLRTMLEIRLFEDKVQELFMQAQIQGTTHLCQGQEAVSVGAVGALEDRDFLTITYRGHGHALARGMTMEAAFGELMGLASGCCSGVGGSMHLTDFARNLIGAFAIIGPSFSVGLGAALTRSRWPSVGTVRRTSALSTRR